MGTQEKSNTEFRSEVVEILSRHETNFDTLTNNYNQLNSTLQTVLIELQAIRINSSTNLLAPDVHPFAPGETSNNTTSPPHQNSSNITYGRNQTSQAEFPHLWREYSVSSTSPLTWDEFTQVVLQRFGPTDFEEPSVTLTRLKQTTPVTTYKETFEKLSYQVDSLPGKFLVGCFIAGLRDEICLDIKIK
ncbi:hypothetical protein ACOSQ4_021689 [Xanthoceras sorbifolium]